MLKKHFYNQTPLYEANYLKLTRLIPNTLHGISNVVSFTNEANIKFVLKIIASHKYTVEAELRIAYCFSNPLLATPSFKLRICHDLQVTEVIAYNQYSQFKADYSYPNQDMLHRDEKQQLNRLLGEYLDYFINDKSTEPLEVLDKLSS